MPRSKSNDQEQPWGLDTRCVRSSGYDPRSPGTHIVGSWVIDSIGLYRDPRTGTQNTGNWASRERCRRLA